MGILDLPTSYTSWLVAHARHLSQNIEMSACTTDLYQQYRKHLGKPRYALLRGVQGMVVPPVVRQLLRLPDGAILRPAVALYCWSKHLALSQWLKNAMLPTDYAARIRALDMVPGPAAAAPQPARKCPFTGKTAAKHVLTPS
jgi:hypothetical protein